MIADKSMRQSKRRKVKIDITPHDARTNYKF